MNGRYRAVSGRIRAELPALERVVRRAESSLAEAQRGDDRYLGAAALNLHAFYSGIERLLELVARHVDGAMPEGPTWHADLLAQMSAELADVRPPARTDGVDVRPGIVPP